MKEMASEKIKEAADEKNAGEQGSVGP